MKETPETPGLPAPGTEAREGQDRPEWTESREEGTAGSGTEDRRVLRTKAKIRDAFFELLGEKEFRRITVSELSARAGINRKTFYVYYMDIADLLGKIEEELLLKYRQLIRGVDLRSESFDAMQFFDAFNRIASADLAKYLLLYKTGVFPDLNEKLRTLLIDVFMEQFGIKEAEGGEPGEVTRRRTQLVYYAEYTSAGLLSLLTHWISTREMTLEEFTDYAARLVLSGFRAI